MRKSRTGSGLIETIVGCIILVPVLLFLIDCASLVIGQSANDALAKHAARAASEQPVGSGLTAAQNVLNSYNAGNSTLTHNAALDPSSGYDATNQNFKCVTTMVVTMPVPIPFWNQNNITFKAQAVEPVVSQLAP